jgi:arylsulfatase
MKLKLSTSLLVLFLGAMLGMPAHAMIDYLQESGQLENTVVLYAADNGASGEGSPNGSVNENKFFNGYPDTVAENMKYYDRLGGPDTYEHFPTGWAVAFSTPFQMFKRYSEYSGGTSDPLVISWPKGIKARGEIRNQYHHSTDLVPTILDIAGLEMPKVYKGVQQYPVSGISMRYTFDADGPTQKKRQYYAMLGTRGIWEDGWLASSLHAPLTGKGHFEQDEWQLYHVDVDRSESKDLAKENPEKLKALIKVWFEEADKNFVLPLDDRSAVEQLGVERPSDEPVRERYLYYPDTAPVPEGVAVNVRGCSYKILANVDLTDNASGVIFAHGSRFGGMRCSSRTRSCTTSTTSSASSPSRIWSRASSSSRASRRSAWSSSARRPATMASRSVTSNWSASRSRRRSTSTWRRRRSEP